MIILQVKILEMTSFVHNVAFKRGERAAEAHRKIRFRSMILCLTQV